MAIRSKVRMTIIIYQDKGIKKKTNNQNRFYFVLNFILKIAARILNGRSFFTTSANYLFFQNDAHLLPEPLRGADFFHLPSLNLPS